MGIEAVIFDMDGLLFNTEKLYIVESKKVVEKLGFQIPDEVYLECAGASHERTMEILTDSLGPDFPLEEWHRMIHEQVIHRINTEGVKKKEGTDRILALLREKNMPLAVASSSGRKSVEGLLNMAGILEYFEKIVCGDEVENSKPHPEIFLKTAGAIDKSPDSCMVFEDSFQGIRAAHAAGMRPVMVPDLRSPDTDIIKLCFRVCSSLDYAAEIIDELLA